MRYKPLLQSNSYIVLLFVFIAIFSSFTMVFLYSGNEKIIYSITKTNNIFISLLFPFSISIAAIHFIVIYTKKRQPLVIGFALFALIISSKPSFIILSGITRDIYHISTENYKFVAGKPSFKKIGHGFKLIINNETFKIQLHQLHPAYTLKQLDRIKESSLLEIKHHDYQILEISIGENKS